MYHTLKKLGKEVKFIFFKGEGHGPSEPEELKAGRSKGMMGWARANHIKVALEAEFNWYEDRIGVSETET